MNTGNTTGGYRCMNCGQWVYGIHSCNLQPPQYFTAPGYTGLDGDVKDILRRIAEALEKLAGITQE